MNRPVYIVVDGDVRLTKLFHLHFFPRRKTLYAVSNHNARSLFVKNSKHDTFLLT